MAFSLLATRNSFNSSVTGNANWGYGVRQADGMVVGSWGGNPDLYAISGGELKASNGWFWQLSDLSNYILGKTFEFSFEVAVPETNEKWSSIFIYDGDEEDYRADSRLGCLVWGARTDGIVFSLYGGSAGDNSAGDVTEAMINAVLGGSYDRTQPHTATFRSSDNAGTTTYDFLVDGAVVVADVAYDFNTDPRMVAFYTDNLVGGGVIYDNVSVKVLPPLTYEKWAEEEGLTLGVNDDPADDPDTDGMDNLLEYALGGNPLVDDAVTYEPVSIFPDVDTWQYIYRRRSDAATRSLVYDLRYKTDLVSEPTWTTSGGGFESGTNSISSAFDVITNTIPITTYGLNKAFIELEITDN